MCRVAQIGAGELAQGDAYARCAEAHRRFGVRRGYAERYGTHELHPLSGDPHASAAL